MMIHTITRKDLLDLVYRRKEEFLASIRNYDTYIVRSYYQREKVLAFNKFLGRISHASEPSWYPCTDGCPDYDRINDEYPKSYVGARMHSYYSHRWNPGRLHYNGRPDHSFARRAASRGADRSKHTSGLIQRRWP
jgi:hypothetical protein